MSKLRDKPQQKKQLNEAATKKIKHIL